jgi:hypothetical protein
MPSLPQVASNNPADMLPGTVYHYTAAAGLKGILMGRAGLLKNAGRREPPALPLVSGGA